MIRILDKSKCCGCTACFNICPKKCITMEADFEGFKYPIIDEQECINCGLCEKVCQCLKTRIDEGKPIAYAVQNKDADVLRSSTSGGFFTPLAEYIIENDGVVYGVAFDKDFNVIHKKCDQTNKSEIKDFRGSKYVQSELGSVFLEIKEYLESGKLVCFSGTPCQVEGLKSFLNKAYENLITVDLVCHGTPSPKLWNKYLEYQRKKYKSSVIGVNFRDKTYGYHSGAMEIKFESGTEYHGSARVDYMLKSFLKEISSRPSCYKCQFKQINHSSDFTIFDSWNIDKLIEGKQDDDRGYTNVFVQSNRGEVVFKELSEKFSCNKISYEKAIYLDGSMVCNSATPHKLRGLYYQKLDDVDLNDHIEEFIAIRKSDYIIEYLKIFLFRIKILSLLKGIRHK